MTNTTMNYVYLDLMAYKMSLVHGNLDSRSDGMCSCRRCRRVFARRASNGGFLTWIWGRRSDRSHLLRTFWKTTSFLYQVLTVHSFKNPSSIVWLNTQKKCKCYDTQNNVEKPHDSLGGEANRLGDEIKINWICRWYAYEEEMVLIVIYKHAYPM